MPNDINAILARIRDALDNHPTFNQSNLAPELEMSQSNLSQILSGIVPLRVSVFKRMVEVLDLDPIEILGIDVSRKYFPLKGFNDPATARDVFEILLNIENDDRELFEHLVAILWRHVSAARDK